METKEDNIIDENETEQQDDNNKKMLKNLRIMRFVDIFVVRFFVVIFLVFMVVNLIIPLRPSFSQEENRDLTKFPKFTVSSFLSGKYFKGIGEWYSDTIPLRENFLKINSVFKTVCGYSNVKIHGTVVKGDDIPDVTDSSDASSEETKAEVSSEQTVTSEPPAPTSQTLGALLINGDTAYEYYNFVKSTADLYTDSINRAADILQSRANVYDIIVPTSMGITAPDDLLSTVNTSDQKKAIDYMNSRFSPSVNIVPIFDTLKAHKNEYIYFRTDHHWTTLGAYYAYYELMNKKGVPPTTLNTYIENQFPGYLGSFYNSSGKLPQLAANPDTVFAYQPTQTNEIDIQNKNGAWFKSKIVSDMSQSGSKYLSFINGDHPYSLITNPQMQDYSACIVIKESFGNCFVPYLVAHYKYVVIVDYRYISMVDPRGLNQLVTDVAATDVIFINNISATRNASLVNSISSFVR